MIRRYRIRYYDLFSHVYDTFIAMHSKDLQQKARNFLIETISPKPGDTVVDICTGTGSLLPLYAKKVGEKGRVIGVDFSPGMLRVAQKKTRSLPNVSLIQADVAYLPIRSEIAEAVSCSHAFYELKGHTANACLREIRRVLKNGHAFFMMEHEIPKNRIIRWLYYLRLLSMGSDRMKEILQDEMYRFRMIFESTNKLVSASRKSKIIIGKKLLRSEI